LRNDKWLVNLACIADEWTAGDSPMKADDECTTVRKVVTIDISHPDHVSEWRVNGNRKVVFGVFSVWFREDLKGCHHALSDVNPACGERHLIGVGARRMKVLNWWLQSSILWAIVQADHRRGAGSLQTS
jgi:hypothetical protein